MRKTVHAVIAVFILLLAASAGAAEKFPMLWLNSAAPGFSLNDANGKKVALSGFKGKNTVVVAFWHPESEISVKQLQELQKTIKGNKKLSDVKVLAITRGKEVKDRDAAKKKFADAKLDFTLLFENREDSTSTTVAYQVWMLPAFYIVNKKGQVATPTVTDIIEGVGGKKYGDVLESINSGKTADGCAFAPVKDKADKDKNKVFALVGKPAPNFAAADIAGVKQSPGYYKGFKNVIVVFWSPGCPHCRRELPQIGAYFNKYRDKHNVEIIAVCLGVDEKSKAAAKDFFKQFGLKYTLVFNEGDKIAPAYNVTSVPSLFMIDKKGIIRDAYVGEVSMAADVLGCTMGKLK